MSRRIIKYSSADEYITKYPPIPLVIHYGVSSRGPECFFNDRPVNDFERVFSAPIIPSVDTFGKDTSEVAYRLNLELATLYNDMIKELIPDCLWHVACSLKRYIKVPDNVEVIISCNDGEADVY